MVMVDELSVPSLGLAPGESIDGSWILHANPPSDERLSLALGKIEQEVGEPPGNPNVVEWLQVNRIQ
jgi:hypothetical protein